MSAPERVSRALRNIDLGAVNTVAGTENLNLADTVRLMLSYASFKWRSGWRGDLGGDSHSVKLTPAGIEAVKTLAAREDLTWDAMASQLLAFAAYNWEPGWRKEIPGRIGRDGLSR